MREIFENTWAEEDNGVRFFLLTGTEKALIVDTGMSGLDIRKLISGHTALPASLLNTHADMDHIAGNRQFHSFFMHPSEAAFYHNTQQGTGRIISVYDGDRIDLGGRILQVIHLPGHTPGSITLLDEKNRCLIGGDSIQEDGNIFMFGQHRDMEAYISSLERLDRRTDFDFVYPSHAREKVSRRVILSLIETARAILDGRAEGKELEMFGNRVLSIASEYASFLCAMPSAADSRDGEA